jgi:outer membrane protein assembly factor BamB
MSSDVTFTPPAAVPSEQSTTRPTSAPRLWPAVVLVGLFWTCAFVARSAELATFVRFAISLATCGLLTLVFAAWWLANRRIGGAERLLGFGTAVAAGTVAALLSRQTFGVIGLLLSALPFVLTAWTVWLLLVRKASVPVRRAGLVAVLVLTWVPFTLLRMDGLSGDQRAELHWRWSPTTEDLYLAERARTSEAAPDVPAALTLRDGDWPGFRGPERDGVVRGASIATDWNANPPKQLWQKRVGPAWSSMAVVGDRLFTQEQQGESEAVVCLDAATGREVWCHRDPARFFENVSGAGPRATPTFADGRLYALGAMGKLNCLDAATGAVKWSRDIAADSAAPVPLWGFCSSPLVMKEVVVVFAGGPGDKNLLAYRADSGELAWSAAVGGGAYSSAQPARLGDEDQVLFFGDHGLFGIDPVSGAVLWQHAIPAPGAPRSIQPHPFGSSGVLISSELDVGTARIDVAREGSQWRAEQRWASRALKPSFNDYVIHQGHAYGFDGTVFCCVELEGGKSRWRGGRYDHGQVLLLADQGLLVVVSENGQAVLLRANPNRHEEIGRFPALEGKSWSHPAIAHGRLYVRNGEWMACYDLRAANAE